MSAEDKLDTVECALRIARRALEAIQWGTSDPMGTARIALKDMTLVETSPPPARRAT